MSDLPIPRYRGRLDDIRITPGCTLFFNNDTNMVACFWHLDGRPDLVPPEEGTNCLVIESHDHDMIRILLPRGMRTVWSRYVRLAICADIIRISTIEV